MTRTALLLLAALVAAGCEREDRDYRPAQPFADGVKFDDYQNNAYALSEGKRLFQAIAEKADEESPRKPFEATAQGRAELEDKADEVAAILERLGEHGERRHKGRSPHLFRAMGNLAQVLKHKARGGNLDEAALDEIVDMIDEMAKRIERL